MDKLKLYMVEFDKNSAIKVKKYSIDCVVGGDKYQPIVIITHNNCTFSGNDRVWRI